MPREKINFEDLKHGNSSCDFDI